MPVARCSSSSTTRMCSLLGMMNVDCNCRLRISSTAAIVDRILRRYVLARQLHLEHAARPLSRDRGRGCGRDGGGRACGRCTGPGPCRASRVPVPTPAARSGRRSCGAGACGMPRPLSAIRTSTWPLAVGLQAHLDPRRRAGVFHRVVDQVAKDDVQVDPPARRRRSAAGRAARCRPARDSSCRPPPRNRAADSASSTSSSSPLGRSASSRPASSIWLIRWSSRSRSSSMKRWKSACNCWLT